MNWVACECSDSADRVIAGKGKFEELMAASREVAASTAQLVVASKVKADRSGCVEFLKDYMLTRKLFL